MAESEEKPINNQTTENLEGDNSVPNGPNNDAAGASEDLANDDEKANNEKEELEEEEEEEEEEKEEEGLQEECPPCKGGAPAWMATFADMATLLMAFFVLILSFAHMNVPKFKEISGSLKSSFGVQRIVPIVEPPKADNIIAKQFKSAKVDPSLRDVSEEQSTDEPQPEDPELKTTTKKEKSKLNSDKEKLSKALAKEIAEGKVDLQIRDNKLIVKMKANAVTGVDGEGTYFEKGSTISQENLEIFSKVANAQAQIESIIEVEEGSPDEQEKQLSQSDKFRGNNSQRGQSDTLAKIKANLAEEIAKGKAEVERVENQIIVRLADQGSFRSGFATLQQSFLPTLDKVSNSLENTTGQITVEGHTDNVPIAFSERFRTNWDLSAARSAAVADYLLNNSRLTAGRVTVTGFADTKPIDTNDTPLGRSKNRRIEIVVDD